MGKNDGLYAILAIGGALYLYNANPNFKTSIDNLLAKLKGQTAAATTDTTTTTTSDTGNESAVQADPNISTTGNVTSIIPNSPIIVTGNNAAVCKSTYGGSCNGECANGQDVNTCNACLAVCGANSIGPHNLHVTNNNGKIQTVETAHSKINDVKKARHKAAAEKKVARTNTNTCPANCAQWKSVDITTYNTCCKS